ncbi:MAG TPA: response regulator transcription factor [Candidatus Paceibacterota bacterium]
MRVLLIEDDIDMLDFLRAHLPKQGFVVDSAATGTDGIRLASLNEYDLVLLDLNLPDIQGEAVVGEIQKGGRMPSILMLTVVGDAESKVRLLSAGADDYLAKPFSFEELVARMRALLRRSREVTPDIAMFGNLSFDGRKHVVTQEEKTVPLTSKEFTLFAYMVHHRGEVVSKSSLIDHAWDGSADPFSNSLETHMTNLRKKLGESNPIRTVHGRGYSIDS